MSKTYQFNFRADPDFVERVRLLSTIQGRAMSAFVLDAVKEKYHAELKKKPELTKIIDDARKSQG